MKIVAFGYKKGVGKSTAGKFLATFLKINAPELRIKQISFAAKLKDISYQLFKWAGLKRGVYYESHYKEKEVILPQLGLSPRQIWIGVGNKLREVYENTWINFALFGVQADIIIITDLRFCGEAEAILKNDGKIIKINRLGIPQGTDPAEVDLDVLINANWNYVLHNNGSLQGLNVSIEEIAKDLLEV